MTEEHKYWLFRVLVVVCGYLVLALAGLSTYFEPGTPNIVLIGVLSKPWMEWTILAIIIFSVDAFLLSRCKHLFVGE